MWRITELLLFLAPVAAYLVWRLTARQGGPPLALVFGAAAAVLVLFGVLLVFSRRDALPPTEAYVPAQLEGGRIVEGHGVRP